MINLMDMACPSKKNVQEKVDEKLRKYQQLVFELRERPCGFTILIVPVTVVIVCLGGGMKDTMTRIRTNMLTNERNARDLANDMLRTILSESKSLLRKVMSGLVQGTE